MASLGFFDQKLFVEGATLTRRSLCGAGGCPGPGAHKTDTNTSSIIFAMEFDHDSGGPLYLQVAAELRRSIADGEAKSGRRLPPACDLAAVLGVNKNTMFRALRELRDEGLLEFRRGRGITVTGEAPGLSGLVTRCRELLGYSIRQGYQKEELLRIIEGL